MSNHYNPYEDYDEIIHPDFRDTINDPDNPVVYIDTMSDEEFFNPLSVIICLVFAVLLATITIVCYFTH